VAAAPLVRGMAAAHKVVYPPYWLLTPATLPPMRETTAPAGRLRHLARETTGPVLKDRHLAEEATAWQAWLAGADPVELPPHATYRAIIDLERYACAYPRLTVAQGRGGEINLRWAEALYEQPEGSSKGHRDEIDGKYFIGAGSAFLPDGPTRTFFSLWWEAGRYLELTVRTADDPLRLDRLDLVETGYPVQVEGEFTASDPRLTDVIPLMQHSLAMCMHETYMDCPYYEQQQYIGDGRLEALATYVTMPDDRLAQKMLTTFDDSRLLAGDILSPFPAYNRQIIPMFTLWWVCAIEDYLLWRDNPALVRMLLPGVRTALEPFHALVDARGLMGVPRGWNFVDWVPDWERGIPPEGDREPSSVLNAQFVLALLAKSRLEEAQGDAALAARDRATAQMVMQAMLEAFWNEKRGLVADDLAHRHFSEHAQCLALLSGLLPKAREREIARHLVQDTDLARTTIYFSHYLFEAYYRLGAGEALLQRLEPWFALAAQGLTTTLEQPEPSRSDCHAWGAHPLYHYYASLLGIRPASAGFRTVRIAPMLGSLTRLQGRMPHPHGTIIASLDIDDKALQGTITLPEGITGEFCWQDDRQVLHSGVNEIRL
jgi:hypothetical protein